MRPLYRPNRLQLQQQQQQPPLQAHLLLSLRSQQPVPLNLAAVRSYRFVNFENSLTKAVNAAAGTPQNARQSGVIQNSAELQRLREQIQQKDARIRDLESNLRSLQSTHSQLSAEVKQLRERISSSSDEKIRLEKQITELNTEKAKLQAQISSQRQTLSAYTNKRKLQIRFDD